jgi:hypothetical protein
LQVGKRINPLRFWLLLVIVVVTVTFFWLEARRNPNPVVSPKNAPVHQPK